MMSETTRDFPPFSADELKCAGADGARTGKPNGTRKLHLNKPAGILRKQKKTCPKKECVSGKSDVVDTRVKWKGEVSVESSVAPEVAPKVTVPSTKPT